MATQSTPAIYTIQYNCPWYRPSFLSTQSSEVHVLWQHRCSTWYCRAIVH